MTNSIQNIAVRHHAPAQQWYRSAQGQWVVSRNQTRTQRRRHHQKRDPKFMQRGAITQPTVTVLFGSAMLIAMTLLGFVYLNQVLGTASHGSNVQALNEKILELQEKQRQLELEGAQLRSMQSLEEKVQDLNLVTADHVTYLTDQDNQVAAALP